MYNGYFTKHILTAVPLPPPTSDLTGKFSNLKNFFVKELPLKVKVFSFISLSTRRNSEFGAVSLLDTRLIIPILY